MIAHDRLDTDHRARRTSSHRQCFGSAGDDKQPEEEAKEAKRSFHDVNDIPSIASRLNNSGTNGSNGSNGIDGVNGISTAKVATPTPNLTGTFSNSTGDLGQITLPAGEWLLIVTATTTGTLPGVGGGNDGQISCSLKAGVATLVTQSTSAASRQSAIALTFAVTKAVSPGTSTTYNTTCAAYDTTITATTGLTYAAIKLNSITS